MNCSSEPAKAAAPGTAGGMRPWPRSLALIVSVGLFGMIGATGQVIQWFYLDPEFSPSLTLKGVYIILAYPLGIFCIACGLAGARRTFAAAAMAASLLHLCATLYFNFGPASKLFQDLLSGRLDFWLKPGQETWIYCWNVIYLGVHACIVYHLIRSGLFRK